MAGVLAWTAKLRSLSVLQTADFIHVLYTVLPAHKGISRHLVVCAWLIHNTANMRGFSGTQIHYYYELATATASEKRQVRKARTLNEARVILGWAAPYRQRVWRKAKSKRSAKSLVAALVVYFKRKKRK